jgi:hypothetical protein
MIDSRRLLSTIISLIPFSRDEAFKIVGIGADDSAVTGALRDTFPRATLVNVDGSEPTLKTLDWWDVMFGADVVLAWMCLHRLNDAKKQYLYKAVADRLSPRGLFVIADRLEPQQLLHHLVWLKHAGFPIVDCFWLRERQAVFGGFMQDGASAPRLPAGSST